MQSQRGWRDWRGGGWGRDLGVRDDEGSRREAAETGGETAGSHATTQITFKKLKDPNVHLWEAPCEERRHVKDQIIEEQGFYNRSVAPPAGILSDNHEH